MKTLALIDRVGESIVGTSLFSARFNGVGVGRHVPLVRKGEDAEGLIRAGFLDGSSPIELNILSIRTVRAALARSSVFATTRPDWIPPGGLFHSRPSVAYVPPEVLTRPTTDGLRALGSTGPAGSAVASLRGQATDGAFWNGLAKQHLYAPWLRELLAHARAMGISLFAPPVPVLSHDLPGASLLQAQINLSAVSIKSKLGNDPSIPGLLYGLHVHPSALADPVMLNTAIKQLDHVTSQADNEFWGVHLNFTDVGVVTTQGAARIQAAKELIREASRIGRDAGMFSWVGDTCAIGPSLLDEGPAFTSYHPGLTPHKIYGPSAPSSIDVQCGKVIEVWDYNLKLRSDIARKGWKVDDTGLFPALVPVAVRSASPKTFRVEFGKPNNIAVAERLNIEREKELVQLGNARPGQSHVGKSSDFRIIPWA